MRTVNEAKRTHDATAAMSVRRGPQAGVWEPVYFLRFLPRVFGRVPRDLARSSMAAGIHSFLGSPGLSSTAEFGDVVRSIE